MKRQRYGKLEGVMSVMPDKVVSAFEQMDSRVYDNVHEIRLRAGNPVAVTVVNTNYYLQESGEPSLHAEGCLSLTQEELEEVFMKICDYSLYTFESDIANGFVTMKSGNRVGIAGTAVLENGTRVVSFKNVSGLSIRISREVKGCANEFLKEIMPDDDLRFVMGALIISPPKYGKTTVLRDLARQLSLKGKRVTVVDERSEIAAMYDGVPQNDIGPMCDVLAGIPKEQGILYAVRNLSPEVILCDELGGMGEIEGVIYALNAGVPVVATAHSGSIDELKARPQMQRLLSSGAVKKVLVMNSKSGIGKIADVVKVTDQ
ncbi:MAG: stage III sporulation protein AA [Bacillota bacterium]|nr:stage III sporulation protein AA [Bacillota bacterium]